MAQHQVILAIITGGEKWHYITVKNISRLVLGITSIHDDDSCYGNCLYSFRTENKLNPTHRGLFYIRRKHGVKTIPPPPQINFDWEMIES